VNTPGEVWVANVVGLIDLPEIGRVTEASFGPFFSSEQASDFTDRHRPDWEPVARVQIVRLTSPGAL
jgi:hypothetical protein